MSGLSMTACKRWLWSVFLLLPALFLCERYLDIPLALRVQRTLYRDSRWASHTMHLPDLLLPVVLVTTCMSLALYLLRRRQGLNDTFTELLRMLSWTAPLSFLAKSVLKFLFGRINTRVWLMEPTRYGFHWLNGGEHFEGFPSGHMTVLVALLAVCWRHYPRYRPFWVGLMLLLAAALVATNYHFLSDVIAGGYVALALEAALWAVLHCGSPSPDCRATGGGSAGG